mmetsp:Transcript_13798/g.30977  ORF Transcript_13798/g.30977 Transcript_13798/m.30977 type:complete len:559 (+) Transcript_13798:83-1759(+)
MEGPDSDEEEREHKATESQTCKVRAHGRLQPTRDSTRTVYAGLEDEEGLADKQEVDPCLSCGGNCGCLRCLCICTRNRISASACCMALHDDRSDTHRYVVHFLLCCFLPGPYFMDAQFGAYEKQVCYDVLNIEAESFEWFFALPALTGALCGPMGALIARWGDTVSALVAGALVGGSALAVVMGLQLADFRCVLIARTTFWLGIYLLYAVQTIVVYQLFQGQSLTIAYGFLISLMRAGCVLGYFMSGTLYTWMRDPVSALKLSVGLVGGAVLATFAFAWLRSERVRACLIPDRRGNVTRTVSSHNRLPSLSQLSTLRPKTWLLMAQIGLLYGVTFPFETIASEYFEMEWGLLPQAAGEITSIAPMFGIFAWVYGFLMNGLPAMLRMNVLAWLAYITAFVLLLTKTPSNPVFAMCAFGKGYAYMATINWVLLPLTLGQGNRIVAVSLAYTSLAVSMFFSNLFVGYIQETGGFNAVLAWFLTLSTAGLTCSLCLWRMAYLDKYMWCAVDPHETGTGEELEAMEDDAGDNEASFSADTQDDSSASRGQQELHHRVDDSVRL